MSDYNLDAWAWDGASGPVTLGWPYASGTSWAIPITFTEGIKARLIRRLTTDSLGEVIRVLSYSADQTIVGEDISIIARTINNSSSSASATLRLISSQPPSGQTVSVDGYTEEYGHSSPPSTPPSSPLVTMVNELVCTSPGTPRNVTYTINIDYIPDIGNYNPTLTKQYIVQATDRTVIGADLDVRWYTAYNNESSFIGSGNPISQYQSAVGEDFQLYYKWRLHGTSTWNGDGTGGNGAILGPAGFVDTRFA